MIACEICRYHYAGRIGNSMDVSNVDLAVIFILMAEICVIEVHKNALIIPYWMPVLAENNCCREHSTLS